MWGEIMREVALRQPRPGLLRRQQGRPLQKQQEQGQEGRNRGSYE